jgi:hypothetical protein
MLATSDLSFGVETSSAFGRSNLALADRPQRRNRTGRKAPAAGSVCLIISPDPLKQMMFGQSAQRAGWRQVVCNNELEAAVHLATGTVGMMLIDTATPGDPPVVERRSLVKLLSHEKEMLTVVCGRTSDAQEEIWARQCGVWMYLPGVAPETDLQPVLCGAKEVVDRLRQRSKLAAASRVEAA